MSGSNVLAAAFASLARADGIALYGSAESLRNLAEIMRLGKPTEIELPSPPDEVLEEAPLRTIRVLARGRDPIALRVTGEAIEIVGGTEAMSKLAASLDNLADTPAFGGEVLPHIDLEYFPGHGFLGAGSTWMTVTLLPTSEVS